MAKIVLRLSMAAEADMEKTGTTSCYLEYESNKMKNVFIGMDQQKLCSGVTTFSLSTPKDE